MTQRLKNSKILLFAGLILLNLHLQAQNKMVVLMGKIIDTKQKAIPYAGIQNMNEFSGTTANENGNYFLKTKLPATLKISALGFQTQVKTINLISTADTLQLDFVLEPEAIELQTVNISSIHKPKEIVEADNLADFEFKDGMLWLLYTNRNNDKLKITDTSGKEIARNNLKFKTDNLFKTENNFIYSFVKDSVYVSQYDSSSGFDEFSLSFEDFRDRLMILAGYNFPFSYYMKEGSARANISYFSFNKMNDSVKVFYTYFDNNIYAKNSEIYPSLNELNAELSDESPLDDPNAKIKANVATAMLNSSLNNIAAIQHQEMNLTMEIGKIFCPLRIIRDSIYIFNFDNDSISVFTNKNIFVRRIPLSFDLYGMQYKKKNIRVDEQGENCYFEYVVNGITHLDKINLDNGEKINSRSMSDYPFLEKIRISNGYAYFCYLDPNGSAPTRKIFKQQLD